MVHNTPAEAPRRRGRPRSFDEAEVLEKARAVFWNLGYAATSLDDLAAATGLNRPSLYAAFGDKHALYLRALEHTRAGVSAALRAILTGEGRLRETLEALFARAIDVYLLGEAGPRGCFIVGTAVTQAVNDAQARAVAAGFLADQDEMLGARFARSAQELAPGVEPAAAAAVVAAMLHSLAIRARLGEGRERLERAAQSAVGLICGAA